MMEIFSLCTDLGSHDGPVPGWKSTDYYFCAMNSTLTVFIIGAVLVYAGLYLFRVRRNLVQNVREAYHNSIFDYLDKNRRYTGIFLYILMAYGSFLLRPLSYAVMYRAREHWKGFGHNVDIIISTLIASVTGSLYFFTDVFMANFYGIKAEIIRDRGDPSINVDERELFLNMVLRRSFTFSFLFFCGSMMNIVFGSPYFSLCQTNDEFNYEWMTRLITSSFILIVLINRLNYIRITKKMQENSTLKRKRLYNILSFTRHIEEYSYKPDMLPEILRNARSQKEDAFIREFADIISQKEAQSSAIFVETTKILNNSHVAYQPILRNSMENHITGVLWLILNILDAAFNTVAAPLFIFSGSEKRTFRFSLLMGILVIYFLECTIQAFLVKSIVSTKLSFGDHLQGRETLNTQRASERRKQDLIEDSSYFELPRPASMDSDIEPFDRKFINYADL